MALLLVLALLLPLAAFAAKVTFLEPPVQIKRKGAADWVTLRSGQEVGEGDAIRTGMGARIEVTIAPKRVFRIGQATELELPAFENARGIRAEFSLLGGRFWGSIRTPLRAALKEKFEVKTATATIGIKGTQFGVDFDKDRQTSQVSVIDGQVAAIVPKPAGPPAEVSGPREIAPPEEVSREQWLLVVSRNQKVIIRPGEEPKVVPMTDADKQDDWVVFNQERDRAQDAGQP
jgi:hypothetical protein